MKKLLFITLCLFVSCSSDSNEDGVLPKQGLDNLYGRWYAESYSLDGERHEYEIGTNVCNPPVEDYMEFTKEGKLIDVYYVRCEKQINTADYTVDGNTISTVVDGEKQTVEIKELSFTKLAIQYEGEWYSDGKIYTIVEIYKR